MEKKIRSTNLVVSLSIVAAVVLLVAIMGMYAFGNQEDIIQGQADVTEYRVSSKVPGRILEFRVKEGDKVKSGDTLALLEAPDIDAKLQQARAAEAAASAQQEKADNGTRREQVQAAFEMLQKAKAGMLIAQKTHDRVKKLQLQGVVSLQKLDEAEAQLQAAKATVKAAAATYRMAVEGAQKEDKKAARALVDRAKGAVSEVNSYVKETVLTAMHDGEVSEIFPQVGELVGTGAPIMNVAMMKEMWVTFNVREDNLHKFGMNKTIDAEVPSLGLKHVKLRVYYMKDLGSYAAWKATKPTGGYDMKTFEVKASPISPVKGLRPGMSVLLE